MSASGSASVPNMAPNRSTTGGRSPSPPTLNRSVAFQFVGPIWGPCLLCPHQPGRVLERPARVEDRRLRQRHGPEHERRDDPEGATSGAAQRPEQIRVRGSSHFVTRSSAKRRWHAAGGRKYGRCATGDADPPAEREAPNPHRAAGPHWDREAMGKQGVLERAQAGPASTATRPRSTDTAFIGVTSMRSPPGRGSTGHRMTSASDRRLQVVPSGRTRSLPRRPRRGCAQYDATGRCRGSEASPACGPRRSSANRGGRRRRRSPARAPASLRIARVIELVRVRCWRSDGKTLSGSPQA